jgi:hypothetical protein
LYHVLENYSDVVQSSVPVALTEFVAIAAQPKRNQGNVCHKMQLRKHKYTFRM